MLPTSDEIWVPPLVWTFNWLLLRLMLVRKFGFLKTETVDWLSRRTQDNGMSS
jgi:hypothetical protein